MSAWLAEYGAALAVAAAGAVLVAVVGGVLTEIRDWYFSLRFPAWKPPNWAFGPIWTLILACAALSAAMGWVAAVPGAPRAALVALFTLNAGLNIFWNVLFFRWRRPDWALVETGFLWLSVAAIVAFLWPVSPAASLLMVPYLVWVSIAAVLNFDIVRLNAPFGAERA